AVREADRPRDRPPPARAAVRAHRRARRHDQGRDPGAGAVWRRASGEAGLPGPADRGQRRARLARERLARRARNAAARRPSRRHLLPLARGPDREAVPPRARARLYVPAGLSRLRLGPRAGAPGAAAEADPAGRLRGRGEPALGVGAPTRSGQDRVGRDLMAAVDWFAPRGGARPPPPKRG